MPKVTLEDGKVLTIITRDKADVRKAIKKSDKRAICVICNKPISDYVSFTYYPDGLVNACHINCGDKVLKEKT